MSIHSATRSWAHGDRPAARRWVRRCTCNAARADSFSADEIAALLPELGSKRRTSATASRSTSTLGCRPQTSRRYSPWSAAAVDWISDRPHRGSRLAACCLPTPCWFKRSGSFAFRKRQQFMQSLTQPRLAIDVGADVIRVIDPNTNALIASVSPTQVTATPVTYDPTHTAFVSEPRTSHERCSDQLLVHCARHARVRSWYVTTDHRMPRHRLGFGPTILVARQRTYRACARRLRGLGLRIG